LAPDVRFIKCTKFNFSWGSAPAGGAYSAPPDPLAGLRGPTFKGRGRDAKGRGGRGREREGRGWEPRGREGTRPHQFTPP